jgi:hypothetical protein
VCVCVCARARVRACVRVRVRVRVCGGVTASLIFHELTYELILNS